jgi:hypothetical protein
MKRQHLLLVLFILLVAAVLYAYLETPRQMRVDAVRGGISGKTVTGNVERSSVADFDDLEFPTERNSEYIKPTRNLFAALYQPPKVVKRKQPKQVAKPKPVSKPKVRPVDFKPKSESTGPAAKPASVTQSLTFIGHLKNSEGVTVFLSTKAGKIYIVKEGERFANNLEFSGIANNSVIVSNWKTGQEMKIAMIVELEQTLPRTRYSSERPDAPEMDDEEPDEQTTKVKTPKPNDVDQDPDE